MTASTPELGQGEDFWPGGGTTSARTAATAGTRSRSCPFERYGPDWTSFDPDDSRRIYVTTFGGGVFKGTVPHVTAPTAAFSAAAGPGANTVTFDSSATAGDINTYYWTFGDGSDSLAQNPVHAYAAPGVYTVTLVAQGPAGTSSVSHDVTAAAVLAISSNTLPDGTVGLAYSTTLAAVGGTAPIGWSVTAGALPDGLTLDPATGVISGNCTAAGTFGFTVEAADSAVGTPQSVARALSITVNPSGLAVTTTTLPDATAGAGYGTTLAASGGAAPYTWAVTAGALPDGLALGPSTGIIGGTPTTPGLASFTVQVTDSSAVPQTATRPLTILVDPAALTITTATLSAGQVGVAYSDTVAADGGVAPYTWSISAGALPDGLGINPSTGAITGEPIGYGTFDFTVHVADSQGTPATATQPLSIVIAPATLSITTTLLADGTVGTAYSQAVSAAGGVTPYTWSITGGALPDGLSLDPATGAISGTPTATGDFDFTVQVADSQGTPATATRALSISVAPAALAVTTAALPGGIVGTAYSATLEASGGIAPYIWSLSAGELPDGLSLDGATGLIDGTPTAGGTFDITVQAEDSAGSPATATRPLSITITSGADSDADGLPDAWEITNFGNLDQGAYDDPDGDGWYNITEFDRGQDPNVQDNYTPDLATAGAHPRLWMRPDASNPFVPSLADLQARTTGAYVAEWNIVRNSTALWNAALAYRLSGDLTKLASVRTALSTTTSSADTLVERALAYDWVYGGLTPTQRNSYAMNLVTSGYNVRGGTGPAGDMYANIPIGAERAAAMAALAAAGNDTRAQDLFNRAYEAMRNFRDITGDGVDMTDPANKAGRAGYGGGWPEGYDYDRHASRYVLQFEEALRSALEQDFIHNSEYWRDKIAYLLYGTTPDAGHLLPWEDNDNVYLHRFDREEMLMLAREFQDEHGQYWLNHVNDTVITYSGCVEFVYGDKALAERDMTDLPTSRLFEGVGHAILRSGWGTADTLVTLKCSDWYTYHQNNGQGAFMIYRTAPLATRTGVYDGGVHDHYVNWLIRTIAQNAVTVYKPGEAYFNPDGVPAANDGGQMIQQWSGLPSNVAEWLTHADRSGIAPNGIEYPDRDITDPLTLEATSQYAYAAGEYGRAYASGKVPFASRQVLLVKPDWVIVFDRVTSSDATYEKKFQLHAGEALAVSGDVATLDVTTLPGTTAPGRLFIKKLLPAAPLSLVSGSGSEFMYDGVSHPYATSPYGDQIAGRARIEESAPLTADSYFLNVFYATDSGTAAMPDATLVSETADTVTLAINDGQTLVSFNKTGAVAYSVANGGPVVIATATLPDGIQGQPYAAQVRAAAGTLPLAWTVTAGALPDGLTLAPATGDIAGTPTAAGTFDFTVTVTDSAMPATNDSRPLSITVAAVNQPPTLAGLPDVTTSEDTPVDNAIDLWAYASDAETPDSGLTFTITNLTNPACGVTVDSNRYIDVAPASNWSGTATVTVEVSDGALTAADSFVVTVQAVNDPPVLIALPNVTTSEDTPVSHAIDLWPYAADAESPDNMLVFAVESVSNASAGVSVQSNRYINVSPAANWNGTATVTISVSDGVSAVTGSFDVIVNAVNDPPTLAGLPDVSTQVDTPVLHAIDLWAYASDVETVASGLAYSIDSSTAPEAGVSIESNRYVNVNPAAGWAATATVTVRASDGSLADTDTFLVTVTAPNTAPTISGLPDLTTDEDTPLANAVDLWAYAADAQTPDNGLTFTITGTTDASAGVTIASNRYINVAASANWSGSATVTVQVSDGQLTASDQFVVNVAAVNDAPAWTTIPAVTTPENTPVDNAVDLWAYASDVETADSGLTFSIVSVSNAGAGVTLDSNRYIDVSPQQYWNGTATVTVRVSDGGLSNTAAFDVTVTAVNQPPVITHTPVATADEGQPVVITAMVLDPDNAPAVTLYYRVGTSGAYTSVAMAHATGDDYSANIPAAAVTPAGVQYYISATDGTGTDTAGPFTVSVAPLPDPDPPVVSSVAAIPNRIVQGVDLSLTLSALADDRATGNSAITAAEWFRGADPGQGSGTPMSALDGSFDGPAESLACTVDTTAWTVAASPYVLHVRARDDNGNWSAPTSVSVDVFDDLTRPAAITDLTIVNTPLGWTDYTALPATVESATSADGGHPADALVDGDLGTFWRSAPSASPVADAVTLDLGSVEKVSLIRLHPGATAGTFPVYVKIRATAESSVTPATVWKTISTMYFLDPPSATPVDIAVGTVTADTLDARFIRIEVLEPRFDEDGSLYYSELGEVELFEMRNASNAIRLAWTATGDDGFVGTASEYDLRYSRSAINAANFDSATPAAGVPAPQASGAPERFTLPDMPAGSPFYVALKAADEVLNWSNISNVRSTVTSPFATYRMTLLAPEDDVSMAVSNIPTFTWESSRFNRFWVEISDSPMWPSPSIYLPTGELLIVKSYSAGRDTFSWTPSASQWRDLKGIANNNSGGTLYWRVRGLDTSNSSITGDYYSDQWHTLTIEGGNISPVLAG